MKEVREFYILNLTMLVCCLVIAGLGSYGYLYLDKFISMEEAASFASKAKADPEKLPEAVDILARLTGANHSAYVALLWALILFSTIGGFLIWLNLIQMRKILSKVELKESLKAGEKA